MGKEKRPFCCHQNFVPNMLSAPAHGYIHVENMYFKEIVLKLATNGQSDKGFLLTSTFVPKGLSAPALGLCTCTKALKYIPGPGVRWAFTGPLVLWYFIYCNISFSGVVQQRPVHEEWSMLKKIVKESNERYILAMSREKGPKYREWSFECTCVAIFQFFVWSILLFCTISCCV